MKNIFFLAILLFYWSPIQAQKLLHAKIIGSGVSFENGKVLNLTTKIMVNVDSDGYFSIEANSNDKLQILMVNIGTFDYVISDLDVTKKLIFIRLKTLPQTNAIPLKEVEIKNYNDINAVSLGILAQPAKKYTPAERRLKTATDLDFSPTVGMLMGGSMSLDPLLNKISGRTKKLKKELNIEVKERLLLRLDSYFPPEYYINNLKIPEIHINGFQIYALDDERVFNALKAKNKTLIAFALADLSSKYLAIIQ